MSLDRSLKTSGKLAGKQGIRTGLLAPALGAELAQEPLPDDAHQCRRQQIPIDPHIY